jgi:hypothetical protein
MCQKPEMTCAERSYGPACEDSGDLGHPGSAAPPPDEMGGPGRATDTDGAPSGDYAAGGLEMSIYVPSEPPRSVAACIMGLRDPALPAMPDTALALDSLKPLPVIVLDTYRPDPPSLAVPAGSFSAELPYCAPEDEPNACERSITALIEEAEATSLAARQAQRNVVQ